MFFTNGALFANLIPRYPEIKQVFALNASVYGFLVALLPLGAMISGPFTPWLIKKFGNAWVAGGGTVLLGTGFAVNGLLVQASGKLIPVVWGFTIFAVLYLCVGFLDAVVDVGQNRLGLQIEKYQQKPIFNSFHAAWSAGCVFGGLLGAGAVALGIPLGWHLSLSGTVLAAAGLLSAWQVRHIEQRNGDEVDGDKGSTGGVSSAITRPGPIVVVLGVLVLLGFGGVWVEDISQNWSALYLRDYLRVSASTAGFGFVAALLAQFVGRLTGDAMVCRLGHWRVTWLSGVLIMLGMGFPLLAPTPLSIIVGFALAGFGSATVFPTVMRAADSLPGLAPGLGLAIASWMIRALTLVSPPLVGLAVDLTGMWIALWAIPVSGLLILVGAVTVIKPQVPPLKNI